MTKSKRIKQKFFTTKGRDLQKAVSSDLLLQQAETSKSIKNYNTAGINYDKRIYNKLVRNMEAQKIASQSDDDGLKLKLKNYGDALRDDLKKSVRRTQTRVIRRPPQAQQLNLDYVHQELPSDQAVVIAEQVAEQVENIPTLEVNKAERKILSLVSNKAYQTKKPDARTIARWANIHARKDKGFVNQVLRKHYEDKGTSETRTKLREEAVKQTLYKTASKQLKLNKQIRKAAERKKAEESKKAEEEERKKIRQLIYMKRAEKAESSSVEPKMTTRAMTTRAKNKIIREKIKNIPINENIIPSVKMRYVNSKKFKDNGITIEDLNKVLKARRKK